MKTVETEQYLSVLRELARQGQEASLLIAGNSMAPFLISNRDTVFFRTPDRPLRVGDTVFYQRADGRFIMHRICRIRPEGIYTVGDAQVLIEGPLEREQIFGLVTRARRKGKLIGPGNFWWEFFEHIWIRMVPLRRPIIDCYEALRGRKGKKHG